MTQSNKMSPTHANGNFCLHCLHQNNTQGRVNLFYILCICTCEQGRTELQEGTTHDMSSHTHTHTRSSTSVISQNSPPYHQNVTTPLSCVRCFPLRCPSDAMILRFPLPPLCVYEAVITCNHTHLP